MREVWLVGIERGTGKAKLIHTRDDHPQKTRELIKRVMMEKGHPEFRELVKLRVSRRVRCNKTEFKQEKIAKAKAARQPKVKPKAEPAGKLHPWGRLQFGSRMKQMMKSNVPGK